MSKLSLLFEAANLKTIRFNFTCFPWRTACKLPVAISRHTRIRSYGGKVEIRGELRPGMIRIGFDAVGIFDNKRSRSIWANVGTVVFHGAATLGHGTKISVGREGVLELGRNFTVTAESQIVANRRVSFGDDCLVSWDVLVLDTDFHRIVDSAGARMNDDAPVEIGKHVWIGCRSTILKGAVIPDDTVVAAGSVVTSGRLQPGIVAGNPARTVKPNVIWEQ